MAIEQDATTTVTFRPTWWSRLAGAFIVSIAVAGVMMDPQFASAPQILAVALVLYALISVGPAAFLPMMFGKDTLSITADQLVFRGRFRLTRRIPRRHVGDLYVDRSGWKPVVVETDKKRYELTQLGTLQQRRDAVQRLRPLFPERSIDNLLPVWVVTRDAEGAAHVAHRKFLNRNRLEGSLLVTAGLLFLRVKFAGRVLPATILDMLIACMFLISLWLACSRRDWVARRDLFAARVRWFGWSHSMAYDHGSLEVNWYNEHLSLIGKIEGRRSAVYKASSEEEHELVRLARFIGAETGWPVPAPGIP